MEVAVEEKTRGVQSGVWPFDTKGWVFGDARNFMEEAIAERSAVCRWFHS